MKPVWVVAFLLVAVRAMAQPAFVQGGFGLEVKRFSGEPENNVFDGTANMVTIGGGGFIARHWTIGAELDLGARSTVTRTTSVTISGVPRAIHTSYTSRRRGASALIGYQTSRHRGVQMGYYVGLCFSTVRREVGSDAEAIIVQQPPATSVFTDRPVGAIVGIDVAIQIARRVAVVPALRAQGLALSGDLASHSIRPSIGGRISF